MKTMLSAAALTVLMSGVAAPALAQSAQDWSGPYLGVHAGWMFSGQDKDESLIFDRDFDGDFDDTVGAPGTNAFSPGSCDGAALAGSAAGGCDDDTTGVEAGIRAGYDFQFGNFVVGGLAELTATDAEDSVTSFSITPASYVFNRDLERLAAFRARAGYAFGPTLAYVTGGAAFGKIDNSFATTNGANRFTEVVDEERAEGYQLGAGLEHRLTDRLSLTGEYLYTSLETGDYVVRVSNNGTTPPSNPFILPPNTAGTDMTRSNENFDTHSVRVGLSLRY